MSCKTCHWYEGRDPVAYNGGQQKYYQIALGASSSLRKRGLRP